MPKAAPLTGHPPDILDREGRAAWRRITKAWSRQGVLIETDRDTLLAYCLTWQTYIGAYSRGEVPSNGILQQFTQLVSRLGLSPVDRTRLGYKEEALKSDDIASILQSKRARRAGGE